MERVVSRPKAVASLFCFFPFFILTLSLRQSKAFLRYGPLCFHYRKISASVSAVCAENIRSASAETWPLSKDGCHPFKTVFSFRLSVVQEIQADEKERKTNKIKNWQTAPPPQADSGGWTLLMWKQSIGGKLIFPCFRVHLKIWHLVLTWQFSFPWKISYLWWQTGWQ